MADFSFGNKRFDGAYCTVDTFRHLLDERRSISHLQSVARSLKRGGRYVLGLHLLPDRGFSSEVVRWEAARGRLRVHTTITVLDVDRRRREETLRVNLKVVNDSGVRRYRSVYKLRTYTKDQFLGLVRSADCFEIKDVYDHGYNPDQPVVLDDSAEDVVFILAKRTCPGN